MKFKDTILTFQEEQERADEPLNATKASEGVGLSVQVSHFGVLGISSLVFIFYGLWYNGNI